MTSQDDNVDLLAGLVGWQDRRGVRIDWAQVESELGSGLPRDYKALVDRFPAGEFNEYLGFSIPQEGGADIQMLAGLGIVLEDFRVMRSDSPELIRYPLYPEVDGVLPWGNSVRGETFFWQMGSAEPDDWKVVAVDGELRWEEFALSAAQFLVAVVTNTLESAIFARDVTGPPRFTPYDIGDGEVEPESSDMDLAVMALLDDLPVPASGVARLRGLVRVEVPVTRGSVEWDTCEEVLGNHLPDDYKECLDTFGLGGFLGIDILIPNARNPRHDMLDACRRMRWEREDRLSPGFENLPPRPPIYPEPDGLLPWGAWKGVAWACWVYSDESPNVWHVMLLDVDLIRARIYRDKSMTQFLSDYLTDSDVLGLPRVDAPKFIAADASDWQ